MLFDTFFDKVLKVEGGYVNDPMDSGGATRYGITHFVAKKHGYLGEMKDFPISMAKDIYRKDYWNGLLLDEIEGTCPDLCLKIADIAVNMGVSRATEFLQRLLNAMNNQGKLYADIVVDGQIGKQTIGALKAYLWRRGQQGEIVLIKGMNCLQGAFYVSLAERRQKDEAFLYGWLSNRID